MPILTHPPFLYVRLLATGRRMVAVPMLRSRYPWIWLPRSVSRLCSGPVSRHWRVTDSHRTIEVLHTEELVVLMSGEHVAQHVVAVLPASAEGIAVVVDTAQILEVDVIDGIVLCGHQVKLTRHLVSEKHGFVASLCTRVIIFFIILQF